MNLDLDSNHPLIAGAFGAFLRLVHVRPRSATDALANLVVGSIVAWYAAPLVLRLFPEAIQREPRAAGLAGLATGFVSMWLLSWLSAVIQRAGGNPFRVLRDIRRIKK